MTTRILIQVFFFLAPFVAYGVFRMATAHVRDWKKAWPMQLLFLIGLGLGLAAWIVSVMGQPPEVRNICHEPPRFENGRLIPARDYECEPDVAHSGEARPRAAEEPAPQ